MSFVGPRPERPEFTEELAEKIPYFDLRHIVKPGITGWGSSDIPLWRFGRGFTQKASIRIILHQKPVAPA